MFEVKNRKFTTIKEAVEYAWKGSETGVFRVRDDRDSSYHCVATVYVNGPERESRSVRIDNPNLLEAFFNEYCNNKPN